MIWYHLRNLKNVKNTHGVLISLTKINTPPWVFSLILNCTNGTKPLKASHMLKFEHMPSYAQNFYDGLCPDVIFLTKHLIVTIREFRFLPERRLRGERLPLSLLSLLSPSSLNEKD